MLPTPDLQPAPYSTTARTPGAPGPVQAVRVIAGIELVLLVVGGLFGIGAAILSAPGLDDSGETAAWATAFVVFGVGFAAICTVLALLVGIPLLLLRDSRPGRKVGALTVLCTTNALVALGALAMAVTAAANVAPASAFLPLLTAGVTGSVVVLGLQPAGQAWAKNR